MNLVLNLKTIVTDFEQAAMNAYKFHWSGAEIKGCFFHFNQAVLRWAFRNGFKLSYTIKTKFNIWLKTILSLPVIPINRVMGAWEIIQNKLPADMNV